MKLKLDEDNKNHGGFLAERFNKKAVFKMVNDYRKEKDPKKDLMYSHFPLDEILKLCIDNGVLDASKTIESQLESSAANGLKLYLGKHRIDLTGNYEKYKGFNTIVICNTQLISKDDYKYEDLLVDKKHSVSIGIPSFSSRGQALDMTNICPPDCVTEEQYDIGLCRTCK